MADEKPKYQGMYCCTVPMDGVRMLIFPDGTQSGVAGLNEILAVVYLEGREVNVHTAEEIVERLSTRNYIVPSARQKYVDLLLEEYGKYVDGMEKGSQPVSAPEENDDSRQKKGLLSRILKGRKPALQ
jgi:hypothetical protein